jgi:hypothetical protein
MSKRNRSSDNTVESLISNTSQVDFPLESLEEEFFFGDPAAWTFSNFEFI